METIAESKRKELREINLHLKLNHEEEQIIIKEARKRKISKSRLLRDSVRVVSKYQLKLES